MTTMPIDNHPLAQRLQFISISVNKLTLKSINIIQSSNSYNRTGCPLVREESGKGVLSSVPTLGFSSNFAY